MYKLYNLDGKIIKLGPFYKLIIRMSLFHYYLPRGSIILLQSTYLRGAFHQKATRGVTWQVDRGRWDRGGSGGLAGMITSGGLPGATSSGGLPGATTSGSLSGASTGG